jgi:DNA anti-recombination protein RmuC
MPENPHATVATLAEQQRQHRQNLSKLREESEAHYKTATQSTAAAAAAVVEASNKEVIELFNTEASIERHIKELAQQSEAFHQKMQQWGSLFVKFNKSLKEIGDVRNWAQSIERDLVNTVKILDAVSAQKRRALGME